jgi:hypothetical protein
LGKGEHKAFLDKSSSRRFTDKEESPHRPDNAFFDESTLNDRLRVSREEKEPSGRSSGKIDNSLLDRLRSRRDGNLPRLMNKSRSEVEDVVISFVFVKFTSFANKSLLPARLSE